MGIEDDLVIALKPHYSPLRPILRGEFSVSRARIPYFSTVLRLDEAAKELELVEQMPSDLRQKWRLEELFQREIDWERVRNEIVDQYLRRVEKLQFFNSITVALLPLNEQRMLASSYGDPAQLPDVPAQYSKAPWNVQNIGGVQLITTTSTPHGHIAWDPTRVFPATIDGQHRLAALKELQKEGHLTTANRDTTLSVLFLVLDERVGFRLDTTQQSQDENQILGVVREIFIDLNRRAVEVQRAREILLDDQEIECRSVRRLLSERVGEDDPKRLPLGLVHWQHNVGAKFNAGKDTAPFLSTVELLYAIVQDVLELKYPKDPFDEDDIRDFVASVERSLGPSDLVAANPARYQSHPSITTYVEQHYLRGGGEAIQPFANLPSVYLRACDDAFMARWRPVFVGVLKRFLPYANFIEEVRKRGGIDGDLAFYLTLPRKAQDLQSAAWGEARYEKVDKPLEELAKMKLLEWPFFAVFQKGLFRATARHLTALGIGTKPGSLQEDLVTALDAWIEFLNEMYRRGLFVVRAPVEIIGKPDLVWIGVALNPGSKTVRWTEATVDRIASLLTLWWHFYESGFRRANNFMKRIGNKKSAERFPNGKTALDQLQRAVGQALKQMGMGDDIEPAERDQLIAKERDARIEFLINLALSKEPGADQEEDNDVESVPMGAVNDDESEDTNKE